MWGWAHTRLCVCVCEIAVLTESLLQGQQSSRAHWRASSGATVTCNPATSKRERMKMTRACDKKQLPAANLEDVLPQRNPRNFKSVFISVRVMDACPSFLIPNRCRLVSHAVVAMFEEVKAAEFHVWISVGKRGSMGCDICIRSKKPSSASNCHRVPCGCKAAFECDHYNPKGGCSSRHWCTVL